MIPVFRPSYDNKEIEAVAQVLRSGWIGLGPKTEEFERIFAQYLGVKHAIATNSCTGSLHLALLASGIGKNDEVITTSMTFVATNHAILYVGAKPVFCDIEPDTLNIDAKKIEALITKKTKAIMVMHYGGHACDMDPIMKQARKYNLCVIEDAAHACGGEYRGKKLGSIGHIGCFSFHAVKNLATGDGGMVVTNDDSISEKIKKLRWMGINKNTWERNMGRKYNWSYAIEALGYKYHMNDIAASIGLVQLDKLNKNNARRKEIAELYSRRFSKLSWCLIPEEKFYAKSSWHNYPLKLVHPKDRDSFMEHMAKAGISTTVHYFPNHLYEMYAPYYRHLPITEEVWKRIILLPLYPDLKNQDLELILNTVSSFRSLLSQEKMKGARARYLGWQRRAETLKSHAEKHP